MLTALGLKNMKLTKPNYCLHNRTAVKCRWHARLHNRIKVAFKRCRLACAGQVQEMRAQKFHESFEAGCGFCYSTCKKRQKVELGTVNISWNFRGFDAGDCFDSAL
jgi:Pyruvate/2-oxoacid:ferredoxin oxidoreductase delta subunit